jgi:hypothetical protein
MANVLLKTISYIDHDECIVSEHKVIYDTFIKKKDELASVKVKNLYDERWYFATEYTDFSFFPKKLMGYCHVELFDKIIPCYRLKYINGDLYFQKYFIFIYTDYSNNKISENQYLKILQGTFREIADKENWKELDVCNIKYSIMKKYLNKKIVDEIDNRIKLFFNSKKNMHHKYLRI